MSRPADQDAEIRDLVEASVSKRKMGVEYGFDVTWQPEISDVQRLRLEPGDALVLHLNTDHLSIADAEMVKERARAGLGLGEDVPVLVLAAGHRLSVVNAPGDMSAGVPAACEGRAPAGAPVPGSPVNPAREVG